MRASCSFPYEGCKCFERMGNDFWFLPAGRCLYEREDTAYHFSGSTLADYVEKCRQAWEAFREGELDRMQWALDDMTERCRTAERRGYDVAMSLRGKKR